MDESEKNNRSAAEQRLNMGKDPGPAYADLSARYEQEKRNNPSYHGVQSTSCFAGNTGVLTPCGWVEIRNIHPGDSILSFSANECLLNVREVIRVKRHKSLSQIWELRFSHCGNTVRTTKGHSFLTSRGWKKTSELIAGDTTHHIDDSGNIARQKILSIHVTEDYEKTFNLVSHFENNFIVRGAIAHNFTYFRSVRGYIANKMYQIRKGSRARSTEIAQDAT